MGTDARQGTERTDLPTPARNGARASLASTAIALLTALALFATLAPASSQAAPPLLTQFCKGSQAEPLAGAAGHCVIPRGMAVDPASGDVYVADQSNSRVARFSAWGAFERAWGWGVRDGSPEFQICTAETGCRAGLEGSGAGQFDNGVQGVALDAGGDVYVVDSNNHRVQKFDSEGNFVLMFGGGVNKTKVEAAAPEAQRNLCPVDPGDVCQAGTVGTGPGRFGAWPNGGLVAIRTAAPETVYVGDVGRVQEFNTAGDYLGDLPDPGGTIAAGGTVQSLAVDNAPASPSFGDLYLSFFDSALFINCCSKKGIVKLNEVGEAQAAGELSKLRNPRAIATDAEGGVWVFNPKRIDEVGDKVGEVAQFDAAGTPVGEGFGAELSVNATGLATSSACGIEGVDLFVANSVNDNSFINLYGERPDPEICPPPVAAPQIAAQYTLSADRTGATLQAKINPRFWNDTRYLVQYGTGKCSEGGCDQEQPASPGSLLSKDVFDAERTTPAVFLGGLQPGTTYHYRFVAQSGGGGPILGAGGTETEEGEERIFRTLPLASEANTACPNQAFRTGASASLPDCRAYELVSPLDKNSGDISTGGASFAQAATDGRRMTFSSLRSFADPEGAPILSQYLATREADGWSTASISPPRNARQLYQAGSPMSESQFKAFSEDLCSGWLVQDSDVALVPGAPPGFGALYRRQSCGEEADYELLTPTPPPGYGFESGRSRYNLDPQGFSADGSVSVFRAPAALAVAEGSPKPPFICASTAKAETASYRWLRNGTPIEGASASTYTPSAADGGTAVQCELTVGSSQGASTATSKPLLVAPRPATAPPDFPRWPELLTQPPLAPTITGTPRVGETLTCNPGAWSGSPTFTFNWLANGVATGGATDATYVPVPSDKGKAIQCEATGTNPGGSVSAIGASLVIEAEPPRASAPPTVSGTPAVGETLTCSPGTWSGSPTFAYQWLRNGANVIGATASTRTLAAADSGKAIQCRVSATNSDGTAQAASDRVLVSPPPATTPPALTSPGSITGTVAIGKTLTCNPGTWTGSPTFAFKWLRNGASAGSTEATYALGAEDVKATIQCQVTAANAGGSAVAIDASPAGARYLDPDPPEPYTDVTGVYQLYGSDGEGDLHLISVLPDGSASTANASVGTAYKFSTGEFREDSVYRAVSDDGERVFWTAATLNLSIAENTTSGDGPGKLYLRLNATEPQSAVSGGQCTEAAKACTIAVSESPNTRFAGASLDGSRALYTVGEGGLQDLYEAEIEEVGGQMVADSQPIAENVIGVMGASEDATRVYFASTKVLTGAEENSEGASAEAGKANLYLYEVGAGFRFVATAAGIDHFSIYGGGGVSFLSPIAARPEARTARVSPDGLHAAFTSTAPLSGYDNTDVVSGEPDAEVYLYDAAANGGAGELSCASCKPSGARPAGREAFRASNGAVQMWAAATLPGWPSQTHPSRLLSDDGKRLFFNAYDGLVPGDSNGKADVYQWLALGAGNCTAQSPAFSEANEGCLHLISSGEGSEDSEVLDATPSGSDVFFTTQSSLLVQDYGLTDVYDARMNGGFPPPPSPPAPCEGEACQSPAGAPQEPTPASAAARGAGNVREGGPQRCRRGKVRRKGRCTARPRKAKQHKQNRRAGAERRAAR